MATYIHLLESDVPDAVPVALAPARGGNKGATGADETGREDARPLAAVSAQQSEKV